VRAPAANVFTRSRTRRHTLSPCTAEQVNLSSSAADNVASYAYDADGNLTTAWAAADMNCDGHVSAADIDPFVVALNQGQAAYEAQFPDCEYLNADINGDGNVSGADSDLFTSILTGGNAAVAMTYTYNGENRLIAATPTEPQNGDRRVSFVYDYLGRRVLKVVEEYDGASWSETARRKFVWSGWLMLVEIDASGETDAVLRQNTWGLDLAGQNGGGIAYAAGGIGGLLAVHDTRGTVPTGDDLDGVCTPLPPREGFGGGSHRSDSGSPTPLWSPLRGGTVPYDANGNVGQVVDLTATTWASAAIKAHYEYAPYGGVTNTISGYAYAEENPWRFSTKQWDPETALGYWGRRYYSATLGRWLNEDPIGEYGGFNLYAYVQNDPIVRFDLLGLSAASCAGGGCSAGGLSDAAYLFGGDQAPGADQDDDGEDCPIGDPKRHRPRTLEECSKFCDDLVGFNSPEFVACDNGCLFGAGFYPGQYDPSDPDSDRDCRWVCAGYPSEKSRAACEAGCIAAGGSPGKASGQADRIKRTARSWRDRRQDGKTMLDEMIAFQLVNLLCYDNNKTPPNAFDVILYTTCVKDGMQCVMEARTKGEVYDCIWNMMKGQMKDAIEAHIKEHGID
jgi:RHS repeat-associated protein